METPFSMTLPKTQNAGQKSCHQKCVSTIGIPRSRHSVSGIWHPVLILHPNYSFMPEWTFTTADLPQVAAAWWQYMGQPGVVAFHGQMGAGKTTFVHALCDAKAVTSTVGSPTFSIINEYSYPGGSMYHIDLYRLKDEEEAIRAGVEDCLYSGNICLVEWPERIPQLLPENTVHNYIEVINEQTRRLRVGEEDK